jgi:crossover junction endodeoxyribonuclease RuvC
MVVLGLDPGSQRFGVGLLLTQGGKISRLHSETLTLPRGDLVMRMAKLWDRLDDFLARTPVDCAAMEEGFLGKNVRSMSVLALARGVALGALVSRRIPVSFYAPRQVKLAMTGYGNAEKEQVLAMAQRLLGVATLAPDEADALAVAFCRCLDRQPLLPERA